MGTFDCLLLATLLPTFAIVLGFQIHMGLDNGVWFYRILVAGSADHERYPFVERIDDPARVGDLEAGDTLLAVGEFDLRGVTSRGTISRASRAAATGPRATVTAERSGRRFETWIERTPQAFWWSGIPTSLTIVAVATLVLLKAPRRRSARDLFVGACAAGILFGSASGRILPDGPIGSLIGTLCIPFTYGFAVAFVLGFTESAPPLRPWTRTLPFVAGAMPLVAQVAFRWLPPLVPGVSNYSFVNGTGAIAIIIVLGALGRSYRLADALERRQTKWVLYGFVVCFVPILVGLLVEATGTPALWVQLAWVTTPIAVPIGIGVAILGYQLFDIDRLISATASLALLGVVALGTALAVVPRLAEGLSGAVGLDAGVGQWVLSFAGVGVLLPVHRTLRSWLDRQIFAEQQARMAGFESLLAELSVCGNASELTTLTGERLDALLQPDSIATYARQGDLFTPIFVRGHAAPAAFQADSMLVRALEARTTPLTADDEAIDPFDRAALTTLGADLVVPGRRSGSLVAFTCLGRKRSGDIYTATDRAALSAVAHAIGERLAQLDAEDLARDTQGMQERLRRYVPGAVAAELEAGRVLEPEEREVSVLFVDLRGYTSFAEGRAARDVFSTLNEHTERVSRAVQQHGGTVVEFNGDGMMAVFGAPDAMANKERAAVQAGRDIVEGMPETLSVGVGIATGDAMVGSIRSVDRWIWSAIGNTTNLAARLQVLTRELDAAIAIDETTQRAAGYVCGDFQHHEGILIRGRRGRWAVFTLPAAGA